MANIYFTGVSESPFNYNQSVDYTSSGSKGVELGLRSELIYTDNTDNIVVGFHVLFKNGTENILSYSVRLNFIVKDWASEIKELKDANLKGSSIVLELLNITSGFVRGSMYVRAVNTPVSKLVLPYISSSELAKHIVLIKKKNN